MCRREAAISKKKFKKFDATIVIAKTTFSGLVTINVDGVLFTQIFNIGVWNRFQDQIDSGLPAKRVL